MSGSANPTLINALVGTDATSPAAWGQQMQNMNALQDYQAKMAWGQALQQSTDPTTGTVDYGKAQALAAGNPMARAGMAPQLAANATTQGQQINNTASIYKLTGIAALNVAKDPSDASVNSSFDNMIASGLPATSMNAERQRVLAMSPADRQNYAVQHGLSVLDALHQTIGQTTGQNVGGQIVPLTVTQPTPSGPGAIVQGPGGVQITPSIPPQGTTVDIRHADGTLETVLPDQVDSVLRNKPGSSVVQPGSVSSSEAPINAAGDSATRKASEGGPPAAGTPAAAVAQRTHDFWISQGYNEAQVAGILAGGPGSESDFNPTASGDKGTSYGQYQHHAERLAAMQKYFGLSGSQMPSEAQQNQYAAFEISPQGPLAAVGAQLKQAQTPADAAAIWTRSFGVPGDKTEIGRRANGAQRFAGIYAQPQGPQSSQQTPPATTPPATTPPAATTTPPAATPAAPASPFGQSAFAQPSTALPAPASQATAPNTTSAVPPVPTPQMAAATAVARQTGRPAPIAGTQGLFVNPNGSVGPGPGGGGLGKRADVGNALLQGVQTAQTTMPPASALTAGPGAPTTGLPTGATPTVPPANAFGTGAFGSATAAPPAPVAQPTPPVVQQSAQAVPPQAARGAGWSAPPGYAEAQKITAEAGAKRGNDLVNQLTASSTVKPILAEMEDVLTKSGGTGFGTAHISAFRQALERLGLTPAAVDVATPQAALETFKKLSAQLQGAQLGTVGGVPTDDRQSLIEASNPSVLNSTAGNKSIIHVLQGTQQALETMGRAWMASPEYQNNPGKFDDWRTKFTAKDPATGGQFDPRTFWLNNMPPDEQHAYLSNMTPKGLAEFKKNWAYARGQGWVEPLPGQPAPGG